MAIIDLVLLVVALVCFLLAAVRVPSRVDLMALGLVFLTASMLL